MKCKLSKITSSLFSFAVPTHSELLLKQRHACCSRLYSSGKRNGAAKDKELGIVEKLTKGNLCKELIISLRKNQSVLFSSQSAGKLKEKVKPFCKEIDHKSSCMKLKANSFNTSEVTECHRKSRDLVIRQRNHVCKRCVPKVNIPKFRSPPPWKVWLYGIFGWDLRKPGRSCNYLLDEEDCSRKKFSPLNIPTINKKVAKRCKTVLNEVLSPTIIQASKAKGSQAKKLKRCKQSQPNPVPLDRIVNSGSKILDELCELKRLPKPSTAPVKIEKTSPTPPPPEPPPKRQCGIIDTTKEGSDWLRTITKKSDRKPKVELKAADSRLSEMKNSIFFPTSGGKNEKSREPLETKGTLGDKASDKSKSEALPKVSSIETNIETKTAPVKPKMEQEMPTRYSCGAADIERKIKEMRKRKDDAVRFRYRDHCKRKPGEEIPEE